MTLLSPQTGITLADDFPILPSPIDWMHPLSRGLIALWAGLPGSAGGSRLINWTDPGSEGKHATLTGMDAASDWVASESRGYALDIASTGEWVTVEEAPIFALTEAITIAIWVKQSTTSFRGIISRSPLDGSNGDWNLATENGAIAQFRMRINEGAISLTGDTTGTVGEWNHVVARYDRVTLRLNVNNQDPDSVAATTAISATSGHQIRLGLQNNSSFTLGGLLGPCAIYNRSVSDGEVSDLYFNTLAMLRRQPSDPSVEPPAVGGNIPTPYYFRHLMGGAA